MPEQKIIDHLSVTSLHLILGAKNQRLGTATGFVVDWYGQPYLVTNWHVVSGRNPVTDQPLLQNAAVPDEVVVYYHGHQLGNWFARPEPLRDPQGKRRWIEHPNGRQVDVVILPLQASDTQVKLYPLGLSLAEVDMIARIAMPVSIIGFPLGLTTAGMLPVWKTGHIASEPDVDYKGKPAFLIDATTRGGMSGSPVILRLFGGFETKSGALYQSVPKGRTRFLGVYSGRIHRDSEIGMVWRPHVITEILNQVNYASDKERLENSDLTGAGGD